jgi:hypothetical protein
MTNGEWMDHVIKLLHDNNLSKVVFTDISTSKDMPVIQKVEIDIVYKNNGTIYIGKDKIKKQFDLEFEESEDDFFNYTECEYENMIEERFEKETKKEVIVYFGDKEVENG